MSYVWVFELYGGCLGESWNPETLTPLNPFILKTIEALETL